MRIRQTDDKALANLILGQLKTNGGYCPCRLEKTDDTKCMCKEFREQIKDDNFEGFCHCGLYKKIKD